MPPRQLIVAGNWKMFTTPASARQLAAAVAADVANDSRVEVVVCPPFPFLPIVAEAIQGSAVALGGQNCFYEKEGAFTGEVSPVMLRDLGCRYVILGHSERRHKLGETDEFVNRKAHRAMEVGLRVIVCVGETLAERQGGHTETVLRRQFSGSLAGIAADAAHVLVLAYEPVWAIGTGQNATPEQAQQSHALLRQLLADQFSANTAATIPILYGGSAKPDNITELVAPADIDGALIGGASLEADKFLAVVRVVRRKADQRRSATP